MPLLNEEVIGIIAGLESLTKKVLSSAKHLKVISRCGVGMDNVDLSEAKRLGIAVFNTADAPAKAVAELTLAHVLNQLRRVAEVDRNIRSGAWKPLMGNLLSRQTVGIIGCGRVGGQVARLLLSFGARVLVNDEFCELFPKNVEKHELNELLGLSDVVTLHLPYSQESHHIINQGALERMKPTAILINTSRGGLIDENALFEAIRSGKLSGAGLDVYEKEPYSGKLLELPRVTCTAHMGSYAKEARAEMEFEAAKNLKTELSRLSLI